MSLFYKLMTKMRHILPTNQFARGVGILVSGTAGSQLLMVLAAPFLTRLFTPEDFGLLAIYVSLLALFTVIASLRYEQAIPLPTNDREAASVTVLSLIIVIGISVLSALVVIFCGNFLGDKLGNAKLASHLWLLPPGVLFVGIYQVFYYWAIRQKNFPTIASTRIKQAVITLLIQLSGYKFGPLLLIGGQALGQAMGSFQLGKNALKNSCFGAVQSADVIAAARRYRHFPLYSTWSALFNTIGSQLPPLLFAALFSPLAAGLYALAQRVLTMPMSVIGSAIGNVFLANAAEAHREKRLAPLVKRIHERLAQIAMPPAVMLAIAGPEIFSLVFGDQWKEAGIFARWMAPWLYVVFITSPLSTLFEVMQKQRDGLIFQFGLLMMRVSTIMVGFALHDLGLTIALFSIGSALCWIGFLCWITRAAGNNLVTLIRPTIQAFTWSGICTFPLWIGLNMHSSGVIWIFFVGSTCALISGRYFFLFRKVYE